MKKITTTHVKTYMMELTAEEAEVIRWWLGQASLPAFRKEGGSEEQYNLSAQLFNSLDNEMKR